MARESPSSRCEQLAQQMLVYGRPLAMEEVIARVEGDLGAEGRVVVRYSGTESKARVMIEGTDLSNIRAQAEEIAESLKRELAVT